MANEDGSIKRVKSITSVLNNDTSDDARETKIETTHKKPTIKKSPVVLPYIKGVSEQILTK